jgi:hypothetical protein
MRPMLTKQPTGVASMTVPLAGINLDGERAMAAVASLVRTSGQWAAEAPLAAPGRCAWVEAFEIGEAENRSLGYALHVIPR